jgi:hypothetical protein
MKLGEKKPLQATHNRTDGGMDVKRWEKGGGAHHAGFEGLVMASL